MYGSGWGHSANKPKSIVQIDILFLFPRSHSGNESGDATPHVAGKPGWPETLWTTL